MAYEYCRSENPANAGSWGKCDSLKCDRVGDCVDHHARPELGTEDWSFGRSADIDLIAGSKADISIGTGSPVSRPVSGHVNVSIGRNSVGAWTMQVDSLWAKLGQVEGWNDVTLYLARPMTARAVGSGSCTFGLCPEYKIAQGDFRAILTARGTAGVGFVPMRNESPYDVTVLDPPSGKKSLHLQGTVSGPLEVNGKREDAKAFLDVKAEFTNVAPVAFSGETRRSVPCVNDRNRDPLHLYAPDHDADGVLPAGGIRWHEDYGLPTHRHLGQKNAVVLAPGALSFGTHRVTLVVHDDLARDVETFDVVVYDAEPPRYLPPRDVFRVVAPISATRTSGRVRVNIGAATGMADACAPRLGVEVTNDAPADRLFPPGLTKVTWHADDGRGNVTPPKVQHVFVLLPDVRPSPAALLEFLEGATDNAAQTLDACETGARCRLAVWSALQAAEHLDHAAEAAGLRLESAAGSELRRAIAVYRDSMPRAAAAAKRAHAVGDDGSIRARRALARARDALERMRP
jgi:hypothetical protein